ncbi:hypothetical protein [Pseudalkalibacillus salsuginis]|uniref:hypothetical protein n=1 Tax=Pseudalkalibacillus salsuginis TaxID=2910972 RepID=UPI001F41CA44|nr:hypothetical protein [Pseudalkalibacillus salsuginis]MCF6409680.1 hypothetical protein [Pseudalkalibacillus salsuginis]
MNIQVNLKDIIEEKDRIVELDIEEQWYSYRDERFKQIAIRWSRDNYINFVE